MALLRPLSSQTQMSGILVEHECPRCGREVELTLGEICSHCKREIEARARRIGRIVALTTTVALAVYIYLRMPEDPTARLVGGVSILAWYILTGLVTRRILREALK
jgi:predicted amidophosphoribosyltransferase